MPRRTRPPVDGRDFRPTEVPSATAFRGAQLLRCAQVLRVRQGIAPPRLLGRRRLLVEKFPSEAKPREIPQARRLPCAARRRAGRSPRDCLASQASASPAPVGRTRTTASSRTSATSATGSVADRRPAGHRARSASSAPAPTATCCRRRRRHQGRRRPQGRRVPRQLRRRVRRRPGELHAQRRRLRRPRRLDRVATPSPTGRPGLRRAAQGPRRRRRRPDLGQRLRRARHRPVAPTPAVSAAEAAAARSPS